MTEATRYKYDASVTLSDYREDISVIARSGSTHTLADEGDIYIRKGYIITKIVVSATVNANSTNSKAAASAYAILRDGTKIDIGSRTSTRYTTSTYWNTYDSSNLDEQILLNTDYIHCTVYAKNGSSSEGASAQVYVIQRALSAWIPE